MSKFSWGFCYPELLYTFLRFGLVHGCYYNRVHT